MTLLGGARTFFGPFVGAALYLSLQEESARFTEYWSLIIGTVLILCVRFFPEGVCGWLLPWLADATRRILGSKAHGVEPGGGLAGRSGRWRRESSSPGKSQIDEIKIRH